MTEKRVHASEKQKKAVREIMKELFGVTPSSDDDDAVMGSFLGYAARLKDNLEKLEIHYKKLRLGSDEGLSYEEIYNKYMGIIGAYEIVNE